MKNFMWGGTLKFTLDRVQMENMEDCCPVFFHRSSFSINPQYDVLLYGFLQLRKHKGRKIVANGSYYQWPSKIWLINLIGICS